MELLSGGASSGGGLRALLGMSPRMAWRLLSGLYRAKRDGGQLKPGDLFHLDGFVCVGTDTSLYTVSYTHLVRYFMTTSQNDIEGFAYQNVAALLFFVVFFLSVVLVQRVRKN